MNTYLKFSLVFLTLYSQANAREFAYDCTKEHEGGQARFAVQVSADQGTVARLEITDEQGEILRMLDFDCKADIDTNGSVWAYSCADLSLGTQRPPFSWIWAGFAKTGLGDRGLVLETRTRKKTGPLEREDYLSFARDECSGDIFK